MLIYLQIIETEEERSKFEQLYEAYRGLLYRVAFARLRNAQDAEDAVSYAFVKIAENIKKIEPVSPKTKQFVVTIVDHRATDLLRARGRHPESPYLDALAEQAAQPVGEDLLTQCIFQLPEQQRTVIWLKYHHGYTLREIAKLMDISLAWAQKIDPRAKKKLEELYREGGGTL